VKSFLSYPCTKRGVGRSIIASIIWFIRLYLCLLFRMYIFECIYLYVLVPCCSATTPSCDFIPPHQANVPSVSTKIETKAGRSGWCLVWLEYVATDSHHSSLERAKMVESQFAAIQKGLKKIVKREKKRNTICYLFWANSGLAPPSWGVVYLQGSPWVALVNAPHLDSEFQQVSWAV